MFLRATAPVRAFAALLTSLGLGLALVGAPAPATAASKSVRHAARVAFKDAGSGETPVARRQRLLRECKGRPNAGACLGMTGRS